MRVIKAGAAESGRAESADMQAINSMAKTELSTDEVYVFSVLLCDNDVDRDFERFPEETLKELAVLFTGTTGISDHEWKSAGQVARIYKTEIVRQEGRRCFDGAPYMFLKGRAYMLRTESNNELIAQIEGGIKKEASIGCSVSRSVCSICGKDMGVCAHVRGSEYEGKLCCAELIGATDAYEWSFVAVPAQKNAGVIKRFDTSLKNFVQSGEGKCFLGEYERLEADATVGKNYTRQLRDEVLRLSLLEDRNMYAAFKAAVNKMDAEELENLRLSLETKIAHRFSPVTQLPGRSETVSFDGGEYRI